jgi:hypothetical protein
MNASTPFQLSTSAAFWFNVNVVQKDSCIASGRYVLNLSKLLLTTFHALILCIPSIAAPANQKKISTAASFSEYSISG